jgi:hypothetical protein
MKQIIPITLYLFLCLLAESGAQTKIEKTIPWKSGVQLQIDFDHPDIKIHTWDKNEVTVTGTASINRGENDDAFELLVEETPGTVKISSRLKDKENIPQRITIKKGDQEFYFKAKDYNDPEVQKFLEENGHQYSYMSHGIIREIKLEIFVPKGTVTSVVAKFGLVEITNFDGPLTVDAKFGKIDASVPVQRIGELSARTRHGEILTNLDVKFDQSPLVSKRDHWTEITAKPGKGPYYRFESKFGNVYLRKPE